MISDKLTAIFKEGKIDQFQYDTYLMFETSELGRKYLKNMIESIVLEEPPKNIPGGFAWQDGKRSAWREIKTTINLVNLKLEGKMNDRPRYTDGEQL